MRRKARRELQLEWDGQTTFWPRQDFESLVGMDSNLRMLADDLGMQMWGQLNRLAEAEGRDDDTFALIENCSAEVADILASSIPDRDHYRASLTGSLREFMRMVAAEFVYSGEIHYEVCLGRIENQPTSKPRAATLRYVPHDSLVRIGRECFQVIPQQKEIGQRQEVVAVSDERIVRFLPPNNRRAAISHARASLRLIGQARQRWMQESLSRRTGEEFGEVHRRYNIAVARATRDLGWNGRGLFSEHNADFHFVTRELRWRRFGIEVRDQILTDLGECFRRIGKAFGENPRLSVRNLPSLQQIEEAEAKLRQGGTHFNLLLKPFL